MIHRTLLPIKLTAVRRGAPAVALLALLLLLGAAIPDGLASGSAPLFQQGTKLIGGEEDSGAARFGRSVALSADGDTALIGAPRDSNEAGAVWVFTRSGSTWTRQAKLIGGEEESGAGHFGRGVALSADGDTALIGGFHDGAGVGAVWVFARSGSGLAATWAQQGAKLTGAGEVDGGYFGDAVALTPDGSTALIGGFEDDEHKGAAWLFARTGSGAGATWAQQGEKLTGGEEERGKGEFGWSVALSTDGATALVGGTGDSSKAGAAWVFGDAPPPSESSPSGSQGSGETDPGTQTQAAAGDPAGGAGLTANQGVGAYRAAGGGVVLLLRRLPAKGGRARVRLRCTATAGCGGRLTLTLPPEARAAGGFRRVTVAKAGFSIARGRVVTVALRLDRAGRSRLRAGSGHLRANLAIHVVAPGPPTTRAYAVKLVSRAARG